MKDWRSQLREHDPAAEACLPERAEAMRKVIVEAARAAGVPRSPWPWRLACATAALAVLAGGAGDGVRGPVREPAAPLNAPDPSGGRRQIQFSTPGGTRIVWELNPRFSLRETLP